MKAKVQFALIILVVCAYSACAQQPMPMYDQRYPGPTNYYGYPTYDPQQRPPGAQTQQQQQRNDGVLFWGFSAAQQAGSYLWQYLPAPLRGTQTTLTPPPGQGHVIMHFVPGSQ